MNTKIFLGIGVFFIIGYVNGQSSTTLGMPPQQCPKNEKWQQCGSCEPTCDIPKPVCAQGCQPSFCQCKKHFFRNSATGECVHKKQCNSTPINPNTIEKRQVNMLITTTTSPGFPGNPGFINPGGPMQPSQPGIPLNPMNPGPALPPRNSPGSCQEGEIWQTCNPCEKSCEVPNFECPTQACSSTTTTTTTNSPIPSPLGLGSFGQPLPPFQGRCVCQPDMVRRIDNKCVSLDDCNSTSIFNLSGIQPGTDENQMGGSNPFSLSLPGQMPGQPGQPIQPGFPSVGGGDGINPIGVDPGQNLPIMNNGGK